MFEAGKAYIKKNQEDLYVYRCALWSSGQLQLTYTYNSGMTETTLCSQYNAEDFKEIEDVPFQNLYTRALRICRAALKPKFVVYDGRDHLKFATKEDAEKYLNEAKSRLFIKDYSEWLEEE